MNKEGIVAYVKRFARYLIVLILMNISFQLLKYKGIGMLVELEEVSFLNILLTIVGVVGVIGTILYTARDIAIWQEEKKNKLK
ncbi:hypothetical protein [Terrisporobacter vanillatitrophus]|uniref:hypothetical protein n=1 Tax=Terrisporobacter vanillatitrophus TaxID=3058402 RepID=UPI003367B871